MKRVIITKNIKVISIFNFCTDFKLYAPIAILYFVRETGSYTQGMSIFSITMVVSALFEIPTGIFSDYIGRKWTMVFGAIYAVMYAVFYALGGSFTMLALGAIFEGVSRAFYSGTTEALLYDTLTATNQQDSYAKHLGKTSAMFQYALAIAGIIGGVIASRTFVLVMWLSVIPQVICVLLALKLIEPKKRHKIHHDYLTHLKKACMFFFKNKTVRLVSISSIISYAFGEVGYQFQAAIFALFWPIWAISAVKTAANVCAALSFQLSGKVIKKYGLVFSLLWTELYSRVATLAAVIFPSFATPLLCASTSAMHGIQTVATNTIMQNHFPSQQRATMGSLNSLLQNVVFAIVSLAVGVLADLLSPLKTMIIIQICMIPTMLIYFNLSRSMKQSQS